MSGGFATTRDGTISKARVVFLGVIIAGAMFAYVFYLFRLQIVLGAEFQDRARQVSLRSVPVPAQRGEVFDRNFDVPLATNVDSFAVDLILAEVPQGELDRVLSRLAGTLEISVEELRRRIPARPGDPFQPIELYSGLSLDIITRIAEVIDDYPGISWRNKPIRNYLFGSRQAQVMGYVGDITHEELQVLFNEGYNVGTVLGKAGIEKQYDMTLRGVDGRRFRVVDVRGRKVDGAGAYDDPPVAGKNVVLTIDRRIQELAEKSLGERVGSVVVLKPATGEVLAMVSYPNFDPNIFNRRDASRIFRDLALDSGFPFLNRTIQSAYAPASVYKTILTAAILEEGVFPADKTVYCPGYYQFGDRVFNCHKKSGHGALALFDALAESCGVYFFEVGTEYLGIDRLVEYGKRFGIGKLTEIDLPGEVSGTLPSPSWKERRFNARWVGGDTVNTTIGQGFLATTPLQLANAVALVVNGGTVFRPHLLKEVREPLTGEIVEKSTPQVLFESPLHPVTLAGTREALRRVITKGTARVVVTTRVVEVAGKTGTGEVGLEDQWHSWFAAYAPYETENPEERVVVVVQVEAVNKWEWWAPKAANIIFQGIFADQTYEEAVRTLRPWYVAAPEVGQ